MIKQVVNVIKGIPAELAKCKCATGSCGRASGFFDGKLVDLVEGNAKKFGYSSSRMYSGPGHDAQYVADVLPATMIFVPSVGGHSHCEIESTPLEACLRGERTAEHGLGHRQVSDGTLQDHVGRRHVIVHRSSFVTTLVTNVLRPCRI